MTDRFARNEGLFGKAGQARIGGVKVVVVGAGGLGTHVIQQVTLLGVGGIAPIDNETLDTTNLNRYVGVGPDDVGRPKVELAERLAKSINPSIAVTPVSAPLQSADAFNAVQQADWVFGCLDNDGARLVLTELCAAYDRPYIDLASDVLPGEPPTYGGRVCVARGEGCPVCLGILDLKAAREDLESPEARRDRERIYGVNRELLGEGGPSVVSINGVVASLAVTEFMAAVTGLREPQRLLNYYANVGIVRLSNDQPSRDCYFCNGIRGRGVDAGIERYITTS